MGWSYNPEPEFVPNCKILILKPLPEVWAEFQPEVGKIHDALYANPGREKHGFCLIEVKGKKVVVRHGEYVRMD